MQFNLTRGGWKLGLPLILAALALGIALPVLAIVRDRAQAAKCLNDAKGIALACKFFALDHQGDYPATLDQLVPKYLPDAKIFKCPLRKNQPPMGYDYFGGKDSDPSLKVLLSSKATTRDHKRIIITSDGAGVLHRDFPPITPPPAPPTTPPSNPPARTSPGIP